MHERGNVSVSIGASAAGTQARRRAAIFPTRPPTHTPTRLTSHRAPRLAHKPCSSSPQAVRSAQAVLRDPSRSRVRRPCAALPSPTRPVPHKPRAHPHKRPSHAPRLTAVFHVPPHAGARPSSAVARKPAQRPVFHTPSSNTLLPASLPSALSPARLPRAPCCPQACPLGQRVQPSAPPLVACPPPRGEWTLFRNSTIALRWALLHRRVVDKVVEGCMDLVCHIHIYNETHRRTERASKGKSSWMPLSRSARRVLRSSPKCCPIDPTCSSAGRWPPPGQICGPCAAGQGRRPRLGYRTVLGGAVS